MWQKESRKTGGGKLITTKGADLRLKINYKPNRKRLT